MITVTVYPSGGLISRKQWRWTARSANNRVVATSGSEKYYNKQDLVDTLHLLFSSNIGVRVRMLDEKSEPRRIR